MLIAFRESQSVVTARRDGVTTGSRPKVATRLIANRAAVSAETRRTFQSHVAVLEARIFEATRKRASVHRSVNIPSISLGFHNARIPQNGRTLWLAKKSYRCDKSNREPVT